MCTRYATRLLLEAGSLLFIPGYLTLELDGLKQRMSFRAFLVRSSRHREEALLVGRQLLVERISCLRLLIMISLSTFSMSMLYGACRTWAWRGEETWGEERAKGQSPRELSLGKFGYHLIDLLRWISNIKRRTEKPCKQSQEWRRGGKRRQAPLCPLPWGSFLRGFIRSEMWKSISNRVITRVQRTFSIIFDKQFGLLNSLEDNERISRA